METKDIKQEERPSDAHIAIQGNADVSIIGTDKAQHFADTVGFVSDGKAIEKHYDQPAANLNYLRPFEEDSHTIEKYLSRPTLIETTLWSQSIEKTYDVMDTLRNHKNFAIFRQKLAGFYGFNATANLKIVVNAQPFHSGILQLSFQPMSATLTKYSGYHRYEKLKTKEQMLCALSGYPCTYLNIATQSDTTFSIPYCGQTPFMNLTNDEQDFGVFNLHDFAPLRDSTNNASLDVSVYLFFTNVQLFGSTALTKDGITGQAVFAQPQVERANKKVPQNRASEVAANVAANPPPGRGLISQGARWLVGKIPVVGDIAQGIFDFLGLSKPVTSQSPIFVSQLPVGNLVTYDANIPAIKFSAKAGQNTDIQQLGIEKADEMMFQTIVAKPTLLTSFNWITTQEPGKMLLSIPVEPQAHIIGPDNTALMCPRLRYLANVFRFWRGTLRYTFHVSANKFHTGRLRFVYTIGGDPGDLHGNYSYSFNQIIDIRDGLTFAIDCPYFCDTPWRVIPHYYDAATKKFVQQDPKKKAIYDLLPCYLQVYVENVLRAGGQASNMVPIRVMVSGGPDFQLAGPIAPSVLPIPMDERKPAKAIVAKPQVETDEGQNDINVISMIALSDIPQPPNELACLDTMGEEISSVREMIKRYYPMTSGQTPQNSISILGYPWHLPCNFKDIKANGSYTNQYVADPFSYFSELYAFWRGGMRYNVAMQDAFLRVSFLPQNAQFSPIELIDSESILSPWKVIKTSPQEVVAWMPTINQQPTDTSVTGGFNFEVPFYSKNTKIVSCRVKHTVDHMDLVQNGLTPTGVVVGTITASGKRDYTISRACADDFTFGYLVGVPPCDYNLAYYYNSISS